MLKHPHIWIEFGGFTLFSGHVEVDFRNISSRNHWSWCDDCNTPHALHLRYYHETYCHHLEWWLWFMIRILSMYKNTNAHINMNICMHACTSIHPSIHPSIHTYIHLFNCIYTYIYIYIIYVSGMVIRLELDEMMRCSTVGSWKRSHGHTSCRFGTKF